MSVVVAEAEIKSELPLPSTQLDLIRLCNHTPWIWIVQRMCLILVARGVTMRHCNGEVLNWWSMNGSTTAFGQKK